MLSVEAESIIHALEEETKTMERQQLLRQLWRLDHRAGAVSTAQELQKKGEVPVRSPKVRGIQSRLE